MVQFLLVRRDDLVHIGLQFANFRLDQPAVTGGTRPRLVALDNASIAVTFPPQALSEDDFVWHDLSRRTFSIAAGSSRVTFTVPAGTALELTAEGVLTALQSPNVTVVPSAFGTANPPTAHGDLPCLCIGVRARGCRRPNGVVLAVDVSGKRYLLVRNSFGSAARAFASLSNV